MYILDLYLIPNLILIFLSEIFEGNVKNRGYDICLRAGNLKQWFRNSKTGLKKN